MASSSSCHSGLSATALKRLQRDLRELQENPVEFVNAAPYNDDIATWSVNMVAADGNWKGLPIHLHVEFPHNYPDFPPRVSLITRRLSHPNVFGGWICLDMIKDPAYYSRPYQGWSSTYTISSLLRQLYGFLLVDEVIHQDYGGAAERRSDYGRHSQQHGPTWLEDIHNCSCGHHTLPAGVSIHRCNFTLANFISPASAGPASSTRSATVSSTARRNFNRRQRRRAAAAGSTTPTSSIAPSSPRSLTPSIAEDENLTDLNQMSPGPITPNRAANAGNIGDASIANGAAADGPVDGISSEDAESALEASSAPCYLLMLNDVMLRLVMEKLGQVELNRCIRIGGRLARIARDVLQRSEQLCFHTKTSSTDCVVGYGIQRMWHGSSNDIRSLSTTTDYISMEAFESGVRRSAWNIPFDSFLPLYLNPPHGTRSLRLLPQFIHGMLNRSCTTGRDLSLGAHASTALKSSDLLRVIAQLMNSLLVEIVNLTPQPAQDPTAPTPSPSCNVSRHMSDVALQAFCHLHHLLLAVALQPGSSAAVLQEAQRDVTRFIRFPDSRHKSKCPDLGVLLVEFLLVPKEAVPWSAFAPALLRELLSRNVYWAIKKHGDSFAYTGGQAAADGGSPADFKRLKQHFESADVGLRNVLLQAWFANALARPSTTAGLREELGRIKAQYDECSGLPPADVFDAFNTHARSVLTCGSWVAFLKGLRLGTRAGLHPRALMAAMLRQAVVDSYMAGYHRRPHPLGLSDGGAGRGRGGMGQGGRGGRGQGGRGGRDREVPCYLNWAQRPVGVISDKWL